MISPLAFFSAISLLLLTACTPNISPWERGILAKPHMAIQSNTLESSLRKHIQVSKEASTGGHSVGGGGCGCS